MMEQERQSLFRVCVSPDGSGTIYSMRLTQPVEFSDLGSLMLKVERVLEQTDNPQAYQRMRTFRGSGRPPVSTQEQTMSWQTVEAARGSKTTFELLIRTRRKATWQGEIRWQDGTSQRFENDLEFLRLAGKALG